MKKTKKLINDAFIILFDYASLLNGNYVIFSPNNEDNDYILSSIGDISFSLRDEHEQKHCYYFEAKNIIKVKKKILDFFLNENIKLKEITIG